MASDREPIVIDVSHPPASVAMGLLIRALLADRSDIRRSFLERAPTKRHGPDQSPRAKKRRAQRKARKIMRRNS